MKKKSKAGLKLEYIDFPFKYVLAKINNPISEVSHKAMLEEVLSYCDQLNVRKLIIDFSAVGFIHYNIQEYEKEVFSEVIKLSGGFYRAIIVSADVFFGFSIFDFQSKGEIEYFQYFSNLEQGVIWLHNIADSDVK